MNRKLEPMDDRRSEWFVPKWGPIGWRIAIGLLFLPYTGMVLSYTVIGAMLSPTLFWDRVAAIVIIYFLGLGVAAHALDAIGAKNGVKPWGSHFSRTRLWGIAITALVFAYGIGLYYIVTASPWLAVIALLEGFFLFAYNLEWFHGRFHTDYGFAFSWGVLPVLAGYIIQTNALSWSALLFASGMGLISLVEINASRPYKALKRESAADLHVIATNGRDIPEEVASQAARYETILKCVSLSVILIAGGMILWRLQH